MLVYLDNILSSKDAPNENYPREILELSAFGVDNRYLQSDIEQLARAFTGWNVCKVPATDMQPFPASALSPPNDCAVEFDDDVIIGLGPGWTYFKGTAEPSPGGGGEATTAWADVDFVDSGWLAGSTGYGYGYGDDATVLTDMSGSYVSAYLRREFTVDDPSALDNLLLEVAYDDGFVGYLNGVEVARSESMMEAGNPPAFDQNTDELHEVDLGPELFNLNAFRFHLRPAPEGHVLAIEVHNGNVDSSDLSMLPRLVDRTVLPGSVENRDRNGVWAFRFDPDGHDTTAKTIFAGTAYQIDIPPGRLGSTGVLDALDALDEFVRHPSTAEFISIKLIQRFVSDGISLATFKDLTVPIELREFLADSIAAWNSTDPPGNVETVLRTILDPAKRTGVFWSDLAYRAKVKTPVEFINSSLRVLEADANGDGLPRINDSLGMHLFTRDEPDGWSAVGFDWIHTGAVLNRMTFVDELADNASTDAQWNTLSFVDSRGLDTPEKIVDYFSELMFQDTVPSANRQLLLDFLATDVDGNPSPLNRSSATEFQRRVEEVVGLMLSMLQWNFQ